MTVQELIAELNKVKDKSKTVTIIDFHMWSGIKEKTISSINEEYDKSEMAIEVEEIIR